MRPSLGKGVPLRQIDVPAARRNGEKGVPATDRTDYATGVFTIGNLTRPRRMQVTLHRRVRFPDAAEPALAVTVCGCEGYKSNNTRRRIGDLSEVTYPDPR
jgi:hypothetical protein